MPYDIRRLRGFAAALLAVVAGLACYGLALRATLGQTGPWITLRSQTFNVPIAPEGSIKRVLGIKRDLSSGVHVAPGERLGILVGASTLQLGVDPAILDAEVGKGYRWTSIYTVAHAHEIALVVRSMFQAGVVPKVMVLVGNPGILVADGDEQAEPGWYDPRPFLTSLRERKLKTAMGELVTLTMVPWNVAFPYRGRVFTLVDRWLFQTKFAMLQGLGQGLEALGAPEADPWLNRYPPADVIPKTELMNKYVLKYIGIKDGITRQITGWMGRISPRSWTSSAPPTKRRQRPSSSSAREVGFSGQAASLGRGSSRAHTRESPWRCCSGDLRLSRGHPGSRIH